MRTIENQRRQKLMLTAMAVDQGWVWLEAINWPQTSGEWGF